MPRQVTNKSIELSPVFGKVALAICFFSTAFVFFVVGGVICSFGETGFSAISALGAFTST